MEEKEYDVVVIGSGPAGYVAAIRASQLGLKTVCIEKNESVGGTCLNVGCIPSKALLQSTEMYAFLSHEALEQGLLFENLHADLNQMMKRKREIVDGLVHGIRGAFQQKKVESLQGVASFIDPYKIKVVHGDQEKVIKGKYFILATGSESISLPFLPFDEKFVLSSTGALSLTKIPKKMIVIGAGVIGVELASVYNRLGTEVVIIEMLDHICGNLDKNISKLFLQVLKKQGLTFHLEAKVMSGKVIDDQVSLEVLLKGGETLENFNADVVLVAVGRKPYSQNLGLENVGLELSSKGFIPIDMNFQTKIPHIYAIGDLVEGAMLAHRASEEGIAVAEIIAHKNPKVHYLTIPNVIYTHPEVATVGLTEKEAKDLGFDLLVGTCSFKANPRARCMGFTEGLVKVIGEKKSGRLIGMHIIGPHASEMIGEGVIAMQKKATLEEIASSSHAHPTLSEAILEAVQQALGKSIHL